MKNLRDIVEFITKRGKLKASFIQFEEEATLNKEKLLFQGVKDGSIKDDEDAVRLIYGKKMIGNQYRMLKSRLQKKLLNHILLMEFQDEDLKTGDNMEFKCWADLHIARVLIRNGEKHFSSKLLSKIVKVSTKYEFNSLILSCLELFGYLYTVGVDEKKYIQNQKLLNTQRKIVEIEAKAADLFQSIRLKVDKSITSRKKYLNDCFKASEILQKLWIKSKSYRVFEFYYLLYIWYLEMIGDYKKILSLINDTELKLKKGIINPYRFDHQYNKFVKIYAYLRAKDLENGLNYAKEYITSFNKHRDNWFFFMESYFLLALHAKKYYLASRLLKQVFENSHFENLHKNSKERWNLFRSYLYMVYPRDEVLKDFNFQKFVSEMPKYSKDKKGFNVAILILQYLNYLKKHDLVALEYRMQSLSKYKDRYFKDTFSERSRIFFRLMQIIVNCEMYREKSVRKAKKYIARLNETLPPGDAFAEIEVIPYEQLWGTMVSYLKWESTDSKK